MNLIAKFNAYAAAFEDTYVDGNWQRLDAYFTENAEHDGALGRSAVIEKLRDSVASLDKKMDSRRLEFLSIQQEGNAVIVEWRVRYTRAGCPELIVDGTETATFEGDRIVNLHDSFNPKSVDDLKAWMGEHGAKITP